MRWTSRPYLLVLVLAAACEKPQEPVEPASPDPVAGVPQEEKVEPVADVPGETKPPALVSPTPADSGQDAPTTTGRTWTRPLVEEGTGDSPGGHEVELRMNGERVRVWRPSLANPFVVAAGQYDQQPVPLPGEVGGEDAPRLNLVSQRTMDIIRRVPQTLNLVLENPEGVGQIRGYYVQFEGYPGHYFVPAELDSEVFGAAADQRGRVTIGFFLDEVFPPGTERNAGWAARYDQPFDVRMTVWAVDRTHRVSGPVVQELHVLPVGRGDLEVTLSMSLPTDLDLYVVEPNGNVIYYNNMRSWTNGQLDLDANAACRAHTNVRYEHIFWPEGGVPEGTYQVRVDNWANCVGGQSVDYQVIVQNCGEITIYEGTAQGPGGRDNCVHRNTWSCQEIATIEVRPCEREPDGS